MIRPDDLRRILSLLKATFSHLIIDVSKSFSRLDMAVMEVSDRVLLVTQLDLSCLRNVIRIMQLLDHYPLIKGKVEIIVNRVGLEDCDISLNKALETIGRSVYWQLPNDYSVMSGARNNGIPLAQFAPRAKLTKAISEMIHRLTAPVDPAGRPVEEPAKKRGGLFGLFAGR
jgi:pilus assembly protein CpaE